jgi:GTP pyrophosphokinase
VYDIYAIRIIIGNIPETEKAVCWKVYSLITDMYPPNPARLRDWISAPKPSGYEALHTTVRGPEGRWVEVQIRTRRMDDIAEKGEAAHWKYKAGSISFEPDEWLSGLREKLENPDKQSPDGETAGTIDLADPHIFIFTPQGDLKRLPEGSTVLDFAFSVHSSIGSTCTGANVNGKIVPIKNTLKNGDTVEILTSKNQKPKKDWLTVVVSPRVKQKIRKLLRDEELHEANAGKEILTRKLKNWKIPFAESDVDMIVRRLKYETHMALYYDIATGKLDPLKIKEVIHQDGKGGVPEKELPVPEKKKARDEKSGDVIYLDKNLVNVNYTLASCCTPVFGDEVFGFITISKGISVHRLNCPNARDLQKRYNYRIVHVKWRQISSATSFQATLKIQGIDDMGILNTITDIITHEMEVNIRSVSIESDKGIFKGIIKVFVKDSKQIDALIHRLMKIKGVLKVSRTERNTVGR